MNNIAEFIKNKFFRSRSGQLRVPGKVMPINMTRILLKPKNILIIPYNRVGTVHLVTKVFSSFRELFDEVPAVDEIITFEDFIENPHSKEFQTFGRKLAASDFDLSFFLSYQFDLNMSYLTRLSQADLRVSFMGKNDVNYFNVEIVPKPGTRYEVDRYLEMLRTLGIVCSTRDYTMTVDESIRKKAKLRFLPADPVSSIRRLVGFDLTREIVGDPIVQKNAEHVIKTLVSDLKATVTVFFEPEKKVLAAALKEIFGKNIILVEDRPISLLAGMMLLCRFLITHNTDLFQLAVALKAPTIGILTKEEMIQWSPGESEHLVHLKHKDSSWPSSNLIVESVKRIINQTKNKPDFPIN